MKPWEKLAILFLAGAAMVIWGVSAWLVMR